MFFPFSFYSSRTPRSLSSVCIAFFQDHVVLGGGQEAMEVTTTHGKQGKFDAKFYHMVRFWKACGTQGVAEGPFSV
jgi:hypothetical protein